MRGMERRAKMIGILLAGLMIFSVIGWSGTASAFPRQGAFYFGKMGPNFNFSESGIGVKELYIEVDGGQKQTITLNQDYASAFNPMPDLLDAINSQLSGAQAYSQGEGYPICIVSDTVGPDSSLMVYGPAAPYLGFDNVTTVTDEVYGANWTSSDVPSSFNFALGDPLYFDIEVDKGESQEICLNADYTDINGLISAINSQLSGATASAEGGKLKITSDNLDENSSVILKYAPFLLGFSLYQPGIAASTEFKSFGFQGLESSGEVIIDPDNYSINVAVPNGTDVTNLTATFEVAEGTTVLVNGIEQVSGSTANDFTNSVTYTINDPNGEFGPESQDWVVTVTVADTGSEESEVDQDTSNDQQDGGSGGGDSGGGGSVPISVNEPVVNVTGNVDPARGGTVEAVDGSFRLEFPTGDIDTEDQVQVTVKTLSLTDVNNTLDSALKPDGFKSIGKIFEFRAEVGTGDGQQYISSFAKPVILTINLSADDLEGISDPEKVGLFKLMDDGTLVFIGGRVIGDSLVVEMHGFSRYVLAEVKIPFDDLDNHWAKKDIELMASKYVVRGYPGGIFAPEGNVTRAEFISMLTNEMGLHDDEGSFSFNDVKSSDWYFSVVQRAAKAGVIRGNSDGSFRPDDSITREQMAVMIAQALKAKKSTAVVTDEQVQGTLAGYSDFRQVSNWARESLAVTVKEGVMRGKTQVTLAPLATASRAEAAVMLARLWENQ